MNHIKKFESMRQGKIDITKVDFSGGGDGVYALYIDGKIHTYGDEYHNDINAWIRGFIDGLEWIGADIDYKTLYCKDNDIIYNIVDMAEEPPSQLSDLDGKLSEKSGW
jgi:hypothetical protein